MPGLSRDHHRSISPGLVWAVVLVSLMVVAQMLSESYGGWRFDRSRYESGAWWQLFTSQWVHFGVAHTALNAVCMAMMLVAFQGLVLGGVQCVALVGGYAGVAVVLGLDSACSYYAGASGALHGLWAGSAWALMVEPALVSEGRSGRRWFGAGLLGLLVLKLLLQPTAGPWVGAVGMGAVPVYFPSHVAGAWGGLLAVVLVGVLRRKRPTQSVARHQ